MEFVRPRLSRDVLPASAVESMAEGRRCWWRAGRSPGSTPEEKKERVRDHRGETGDVQLILWPRVFARHRGELGSSVLLVKGVVSRWDGTTNVVVSDRRSLSTGVPMPDGHDWH